MIDASHAIAAFGVRPYQRYLCFTPLFHTAAWDYLKLYDVCGGSVCIMDGFDAGVALRSIDELRCQAFFAVPLVLADLLEHPDFAITDCSSLRLVMYSVYDSSEAIRRAREAFAARGGRHLQVAHAYGQTEAGSFVTVLRPEHAEGNEDAVGTPVPGVEVRLLDDDLHEVRRGRPGEICVRSPALMEGYWEDAEATREAFAGGWLHTGDIGVIGPDGLMRVVDLKKDMIRTAGENVYAKEVERQFLAHPDVSDCAVIGRPRARYDEEVVAVVVARPGVDLTEESLAAFVRERLAGFKTPRVWVLVDALPMTAMGKIAKGELRRVHG